MRTAIRLIEEKKVNVAKVVTHILGLDSVVETTLNQPEIAGGKKVVYTQKKFDLKSLDEIINDENNILGNILKESNGVWSKKSEDYVLDKAEEI